MKFLTKAIAATALIAASNFALAGPDPCPDTNMNAWSVVENPDSRLTVEAAAGMGGSACGLQAAVDIDNRHYVQDDSPVAEQRYRFRSCIQNNDMVMPTTGTFRRLKFHNLRCPGGSTCPFRQLVQIKLENDPTNGLQLNGYVRNGDGLTPPIGNGPSKDSFLADIPDSGPVAVEYDLDITQGRFRLWVNATSESDPPAVDKTVDLSLWTDGADSARMGTLNNPTSITEGQSMYIDEFESRRQTFIGGDCSN